MISLKPGVKVSGIKPELVIALHICESLWASYHGQPLVVTSIKDGKHMVGSKHYDGLAADLRLPKDVDLPLLRNMLAAALGPEFDVVLEKSHIHLELDPKET